MNVTKLRRLLFPKPDPNPFAAQAGVIKMLLFFFIGIGLGAIASVPFPIPENIAVIVGATVSIMVFMCRFMSKARGWS